MNSGVVKVASTFMLALKGRASYVKTASRNYRDTTLCTLTTLFVVGLALEYDQLLVFARANNLVDEAVGFVDASTPASFPSAQWLGLPDADIAVSLNVLDKLVYPLKGLLVLKLPSGIFIPGMGREKYVHGVGAPYASRSLCRLASPRSNERIDSPSIRWFASEKNGSGLTATTSKGRRWRMTDCLRNRRTALDRSRPARANNSSASRLRSESTRICNVDVVILKSLVVQCADSISHYCGNCNRVAERRSV